MSDIPHITVEDLRSNPMNCCLASALEIERLQTCALKYEAALREVQNLCAELPPDSGLRFKVFNIVSAALDKPEGK